MGAAGVAVPLPAGGKTEVGLWDTGGQKKRSGNACACGCVLLMEGGGQGSIGATEKPESWEIILDRMRARHHGSSEGQTNIPTNQVESDAAS